MSHLKWLNLELGARHSGVTFGDTVILDAEKNVKIIGPYVKLASCGI